MKPARILLVLAVAALVAVTLVNKCGPDAKGSSGATGAGSVAPLSVSGVVLQTTSIEDLILGTGSLLANNSVEVRNEVAGRLTHLYFEEGQSVQQGALLVKIYDDDLQAQLRKLVLDEEMAVKTEGRQKDLLGVNGVSQQEYDVAQNALNGIRAEMDLVKAQITKTEIRAPFSGLIGLRAVSEGAYLPAFTMIATLQQLDPMKLEFSVPERYRDRLHVKDSVTFSVESKNGPRRGTIYAFEPGVDPETRSIKVRALCRNSGNELLPGAFAKVEVPLQRIENALMLPTQAVIPELRGQKVILSRGGKATPVRVEIGLRNDSMVQVTSGLQAGDTVLISGIMQVRPDMPLKVNVVAGTGQGR
jgi:membrane fusion protein (multidrug efflux system)